MDVVIGETRQWETHCRMLSSGMTRLEVELYEKHALRLFWLDWLSGIISLSHVRSPVSLWADWPAYRLDQALEMIQELVFPGTGKSSFMDWCAISGYEKLTPICITVKGRRTGKKVWLFFSLVLGIYSVAVVQTVDGVVHVRTGQCPSQEFEGLCLVGKPREAEEALDFMGKVAICQCCVD